MTDYNVVERHSPSRQVWRRWWDWRFGWRAPRIDNRPQRHIWSLSVRCFPFRFLFPPLFRSKSMIKKSRNKRRWKESDEKRYEWEMTHIFFTKSSIVTRDIVFQMLQITLLLFFFIASLWLFFFFLYFSWLLFFCLKTSALWSYGWYEIIKITLVVVVFFFFFLPKSKPATSLFYVVWVFIDNRAHISPLPSWWFVYVFPIIFWTKKSENSGIFRTISEFVRWRNRRRTASESSSDTHMVAINSFVIFCTKMHVVCLFLREP